MDVTREGGADAVRAILPEIALREVWARAIGVERRALDPIEVLVADLRRDRAVDPRWLAAHSLRRAWREGSKSVPMRELLELLGRPDLRDRAQSAIDRIPRPPRASPGEALIPGELQRQLDAWDAQLADAIREVVPEPPPLPRGPSAPARPVWVPIAIAGLVILAIVLLRALS